MRAELGKYIRTSTKNRIFHKEKREREVDNVQFFERIQLIPPVKIGIWAHRVQGMLVLF